MKTKWQMTEELDGIKCPHCEGYNRLSLSVDRRSVYCAECGNGITADYLLTQGFKLDPTAPRGAQQNTNVKIKITHNGFHGFTTHSLIVRGNPGDRVQLTESQVRRLSGKACGMDSCKCGESMLAACEVTEPWNAASPVFLTIPESGEICVNGNYPQR